MAGLAKVEGQAFAIVNPRAGGGALARAWALREAQLKGRLPGLSWVFTEHRGHATLLARAALERGAQLIVSVGGDGTNNEVLAGFMDAQGVNRFPTAELALIPAGRGSDFTRCFGPPVFEQGLARLSEPATPIDYGVARYGDDYAEVRTFLNMASLGASSRVVAYANAASGRFGPGATYWLASLRGIANHRNQRVWVRYDDDAPKLLDLTLACIGNGQYFGAGMWVAPMANVADGQFDVIEVTGMSRMGLAAALARVYFGKHLALPGIAHRRCARVAFWSEASAAGSAVETDGELGSRLPVKFAVVRGGIRVRGLVPTAAKPQEKRFALPVWL
jgi:diacylglycerol kinase (ATP)